ncbi:hypothetical protein BJX61DRAFT_544878 [Aspergillus egyptiacus]|nr:hypothetical protein BJX61DRAFT_544878 [Aspergillus egyptiacus]
MPQKLSQCLPVVKEFSQEDLHILEASDKEQKSFHAFVKRSRKCSEEEKRALGTTTVEEFMMAWDSALKHKEQYEQKRTGGIRRGFLDSAAAMSDVLDNMNPILEVVRDSAGPFGGLAVGTIAKNRVTLEGDIGETFRIIRDRLPALKMYQSIHTEGTELDRSLQSKIVRTYGYFMEFSMSASKFYLKGGWHRWLKVLGPPTTLQQRMSSVKDAVAEIQTCSVELSHRSIDMIKDQNIRLHQKLESMERHRDSDRIHTIQMALGLGTYSGEKELDVLHRYTRDTQAEINLYQGYLEVMQGKPLTSFTEDNSEFRSWMLCPHSCMLILAGYNHETRYHQCWLSPVALHMIQELSKQQCDPYAFYLLGHREDDSVRRVLSCLIIQFLQGDCPILRNETQYNELRTELQGYQLALDSSREDREHLEQLERVFQRVLNTIDPTKAIWIILDRVDQCIPTRKHTQSKRLLQSLVHVLESTTVRIRVLAVVNAWDWLVDEQIDELGQTRPDTVLLYSGYQSQE